MVTHTEVRTFEISKSKNILENPETLLRSLEFVKISSTTPSQFQTWFQIKVAQLRSAIPDVTQRNRVLQICSNECRIRARQIIDKNDNVYKTKMKETIHMLILQHQILKAQKGLTHGEYCYHIKQFILLQQTHIVISIYFSYTRFYTFHWELPHCSFHISLSFLLIAFESRCCPFK